MRFAVQTGDEVTPLVTIEMLTMLTDHLENNGGVLVEGYTQTGTLSVVYYAPGETTPQVGKSQSQYDRAYDFRPQI